MSTLTNISENLLSYFRQNNIDDLSTPLKDGSIYELEARYRHYDYNQKTTGVPYTHYIRLIEILDGDKNYELKLESTEVIYHSNDIREIKDINNKSYFQKKIKIKSFDLEENNIRIFFNKEIPIDSIESITPKKYTRTRNRRSYTSITQPIKIDITEVITLDNGENKDTYEVEIEYIGNINNMSVFFNEIKEIFKLIMGTENYYTNKTKKSLDNDISLLLTTYPNVTNTFLDSTAKNVKKYQNRYYSVNSFFKDKNISSNRLVKARNIKYKDLVYGGIVGNDMIINKNSLVDKSIGGTDYYITYKADGVRKYLIFHETGIWLVYPNNEYNLVIPATNSVYSEIIKQYQDSVFDVELVEPKNNPNNAKYFVLLIDCLCFCGQNKEKSSYEKRLLYNNNISTILQNNIITVDVKEVAKIPSDPKLFFPLIRKFYEKRSGLNYNDDGFIFTPNNVIYNPRNQTINFKISINYKEKEEKEEKLLVIGKNGQEIEFNTRNFTVWYNKYFKNGSIVEYGWINNKLVPIKISSEKIPDKVDVANEILNDITRPQINYSKLLDNTPSVCKWKPPNDLTIDFLVKIILSNEDSTKKVIKLLVFDKNAKKYSKNEDNVEFKGTKRYPLSPNNIRMVGKINIDDSMSNKVVEFEWVKDNGEIFIQPRKYRKDKANPNEKDVAEDVWADINDPIYIEDLTGETTMLERKYHNKIKKQIYSGLSEQHNGSFNILDIGSGKGGDVDKWKFFKGKIIAVEPDDENRTKLIKRVSGAGMSDRVTIIPWGGEKTVEITQAVKDNVSGGKVDVVTMMLSMSFFWASDKHLEALVQTIVSNLKPGGKIAFLTIDGDTLEQTFEPINGKHIDRLKLADSDFTLYPDPGAPFGRPVDFTLANSIIKKGGQREYVVRLQDFTNRLSEYGIIPKIIKRAEEPNLLLTEENLLLTSMYSYGSYIDVNNGKKLKEFSENIELPNIPNPVKILEIKKRFEPLSFLPEPPIPPLPSLKVIVSSTGPAINDDKYEVLKCSWYNGEIVRIATIGDGNCFIHSTLKSFYPLYQENNDCNFRVNMASSVRKELAISLTKENPDYLGYTYWETTGNGAFPRMVMQQIVNPNIIQLNECDYSLKGLIKLFNSNSYLGNEIYRFISEMLNINVYIVKLNINDIAIAADRIYKPGRSNIIIAGNEEHFEVIAIRLGDHQLQTVFDDDDDFIKALDLLYPESKKEIKSFDPDQTFIKSFIEIFTIDRNFNVNFWREEIYEKFSDSDPFRKTFDRLFPKNPPSFEERLLSSIAKNRTF